MNEITIKFNREVCGCGHTMEIFRIKNGELKRTCAHCRKKIKGEIEFIIKDGFQNFWKQRRKGERKLFCKRIKDSRKF